MVNNSLGPETLTELVDRLRLRTRAATSGEAAAAGDSVVVATPLKAHREVPAEPLRGMVVIEANKYYPDRDGHIAELDDESMTSSELLQWPAGGPGRSVLAVGGDGHVEAVGD